MSAKMFAPQCNNIYVAAAADVSVRVQIFTADNVSRYDQTSTYTPVDGRVELGDLGDLVNKCILLQTEMQQLTGAVQRFPYATLFIGIEAEELSSSSMVYYCTAGNASDPSQFLLFPTQNRRRTVYPDQVNCPVWIPRLGSTVPTVTLNATYVANGQQQTASTSIGSTAGYTNRYLLVDCSPAAVDQLLLPQGAVLCEYEILMAVSGTVYDAVQSAKARKTDLLIVDTAGRLHNKKNLMDELSKMRRIIDREYPEAEMRCMLVLDATTGQNGIQQAKQFKEAAEINGIVLTKLDGTAKGGVAIAIRKELNIPVWYIGVGEGIDDLQAFDAKEFVNALF